MFQWKPLLTQYGRWSNYFQFPLCNIFKIYSYTKPYSISTFIINAGGGAVKIMLVHIKVWIFSHIVILVFSCKHFKKTFYEIWSSENRKHYIHKYSCLFRKRLKYDVHQIKRSGSIFNNILKPSPMTKFRLFQTQNVWRWQFWISCKFKRQFWISCKLKRVIQVCRKYCG